MSKTMEDELKDRLKKAHKDNAFLREIIASNNTDLELYKGLVKKYVDLIHTMQEKEDDKT